MLMLDFGGGINKLYPHIQVENKFLLRTSVWGHHQDTQLSCSLSSNYLMNICHFIKEWVPILRSGAMFEFLFDFLHNTKYIK